MKARLIHRLPLLAVAMFVLLLSDKGVHAQAEPAAPTAVTITVDASDDPDDSLSRTCTYSGGIFQPAADGKCTFRRALIEASARPPGDRPIAITFNLSNGDPNRDRDAPGTWTIVLNDGPPPLKTPTILDLNGQVTIDGATQPGGRTTGPEILIDTGDFPLEIESENNTIRNLAFLNGGSLALKEDGNLVEQIWMGLSADGRSIQLRTPAQPVRLATGGINILASDNIVRNNTIAGAFGRAININSGTSNNTITGNNIGTRADGTAPLIPSGIECLRSFDYDPGNWYGGWGIALSGSAQTVTSNRIAGLHILQSANDTPPMAIEIFGADHMIAQNIIGVSSDGVAVGVCGQGIKVSGNGTDILDNTIVRSRTGFEDTSGNALDGAILASDSSPTFGRITVRRNIVDRGPGRIYVFGPLIPQALRLFRPARITGIAGTVVTGGNGVNQAGTVSACPNCTIDFYRDNLDEVGETLVHLGSTTAAANGAFTFTLGQPLAAGQGLRTASTTAAAGVIGTLGAGTTSSFSGLYQRAISVTIAGPTTGDEDDFYTFAVQVTPAATATPITYGLEVTDYAPATQVLDSTAVSSNLKWTKPGLKTIKITVTTPLATATATHQIQIGEAGFELFLPYIDR